MAFLFKSKKNAEKAQALKEGANGPVGAHTSSPGTNGSGKERAQGEKGPVAAATPTSSVNNSTNSLQRGNTTTPSPEQANGRRAASSEQVQDLPVSRRRRRRRVPFLIIPRSYATAARSPSSR